MPQYLVASVVVPITIGPFADNLALFLIQFLQFNFFIKVSFYCYLKVQVLSKWLI